MPNVFRESTRGRLGWQIQEGPEEGRAISGSADSDTCKTLRWADWETTPMFVQET